MNLTWSSIFTASLMLAQQLPQPREVLRHHVPKGVSESRRLGPVSRVTTLRLAIGLPLRNPEELETLVEGVSDPNSRHYRKYLTSEEFTARFGPTEEDYDKLIRFAQTSGLTVAGTHSNRMILDVLGTAETINQAFHVELALWEHPTRGHFVAPDKDPWLDVDVAVRDVLGLDNFSVPRSLSVQSALAEAAKPLATNGSGPFGLLLGRDFRAAYAPNVSLTGTGQSIGLLELDGFYASDVAANFSAAGLPPVPVNTVLLNGSTGAAGASNVEVILDIMMAAYMAPGATITVYEGFNWNDILNRMATDNSARQLSSSWSFWPINETTEQIFRQMIVQGQSFFQASGDTGAYYAGTRSPTDNPNVTVVGGTALTLSGGVWSSETTWNSSGGGASTNYAIPSYQQGLNMAALGGSATMRNSPDVALTGAIQIYIIYNNGSQSAIGGTSAAAPLWAGFAALANQQASANRLPSIGFLNPAIYALGSSTRYGIVLHDITTGGNGIAARAGYDLATGWGTPVGQPLIDALTTPTPGYSLALTPASVSVNPGNTTTSTVQVNPVNGFSGPVSLSLGTLPAGVTGSVGTASITLSVANGAASGTYPILVTGAAGSVTAQTSLTLTVTAPNFGLSVNQTAVNLRQNTSASVPYQITAFNGFSGAVTISVSGLPNGVAASTAFPDVITFSAGPSSSVGSSTITVTGTSGKLTATATLTLTVTSSSARVLPSHIGVYHPNAFGQAGWIRDLDYTFTPASTSPAWGSYGDIPIAGDWDNTGVVRAGLFSSVWGLTPLPGRWWLDINNDFTWTSATPDRLFQFGSYGDKPIVGDFLNNGATRIGVFSQGVWYMALRDRYEDYLPNHPDLWFTYGADGDWPVMGDWDNTGKIRIGVFRRGTWYLDFVGDRNFSQARVFTFGQVGDWPVVGDWDNTGKLRIGVFRDGVWLLDMNGDFAFTPGIDKQFTFGQSGDKPIVVSKWP